MSWGGMENTDEIDWVLKSKSTHFKLLRDLYLTASIISGPYSGACKAATLFAKGRSRERDPIERKTSPLTGGDLMWLEGQDKRTRRQFKV